jgi:hypothetical protein
VADPSEPNETVARDNAVDTPVQGALRISLERKQSFRFFPPSNTRIPRADTRAILEFVKLR